MIGENTHIDNLVQIAHNVKIGKGCIIAGQTGIAGSSIIGNNVKIGGQAGISGHLKIGNNVEIGGGSGVIKDIPDNSNSVTADITRIPAVVNTDLENENQNQNIDNKIQHFRESLTPEIEAGTIVAPADSLDDFIKDSRTVLLETL